MNNEQEELYLRRLALRGTTSSAEKEADFRAIKTRIKVLRQKDELEELLR
jgi:hypothetical protein